MEGWGFYLLRVFLPFSFAVDEVIPGVLLKVTKCEDGVFDGDGGRPLSILLWARAKKWTKEGHSFLTYG